MCDVGIGSDREQGKREGREFGEISERERVRRRESVDRKGICRKVEIRE